MRWSLSMSASWMVLSAMESNCSGLMLAPTIMVSTASSSSYHSNSLSNISVITSMFGDPELKG